MAVKLVFSRVHIMFIGQYCRLNMGKVLLSKELIIRKPRLSAKAFSDAVYYRCFDVVMSLLYRNQSLRVMQSQTKQ